MISRFFVRNALTSAAFVLWVVAMVLLLQACGSNSSDNTSEEIKHRIFVTSAKYDADLGGLDGADNICTSTAAAAGIVGSYRALISGVIFSARGRLQINGEIYMKTATQEIKVADSGNKFWTEHLINPINVDENGLVLATIEQPWTATGVAGFPLGETCFDWTRADPSFHAITGDTSETHPALWHSNGVALCNSLRPLFCVEE